MSIHEKCFDCGRPLNGDNGHVHYSGGGLDEVSLCERCFRSRRLNYGRPVGAMLDDKQKKISEA